jgi:CheY-like chemotaxis protein
MAKSQINNIHVAEDGEEAVLYLRGEGKFSGSPRPDIIILDLNLPEVLPFSV